MTRAGGRHRRGTARPGAADGTTGLSDVPVPGDGTTPLLDRASRGPARWCLCIRSGPPRTTSPRRGLFEHECSGDFRIWDSGL